MYRRIIRLWESNFNKGVSLFQMCLMGSMILGGIVHNQFLIIFSMVTVLFGYFESNISRFYLNLNCLRLNKGDEDEI